MHYVSQVQGAEIRLHDDVPAAARLVTVMGPQWPDC